MSTTLQNTFLGAWDTSSEQTDKNIILEELTLQLGKETIENRDHKIKSKLHNSLGGSVLAKLLQSRPTLCDPMDCSPLGALSMRFSRQECWSGSSCPYG